MDGLIPTALAIGSAVQCVASCGEVWFGQGNNTTAFTALAAAGHPVPPVAIDDALADAYNAPHDEELSLFPDAHETRDRLKKLGIKLALIQRGRRAASAAFRNCCCSRASWRASRAVTLLWFMAGTAASAQTGPGVGYDRAALTEAICRQYATAQRGMPYDTTYAQCMYARDYRVPGFSPSPDSPGYQGELPGPAAHNGGA